MNFFKTLCVAGLLCAAVTADAAVIKFATLAPKGSTWGNIMDEFAADVDAKTAGGVKFKIYAGGVQGDEKDVIRKIRLGQLHSGGFTGFGIGEIAPELRVLDAPFLFKEYGQIDYVYEKFDARFRKVLEDKGYVLLGWAEVGFVYLYTNTPVAKIGDLKSVKLWMWEGDPVAQAAFKAINTTPVPLSITDVTTSLQTGLIDGVYGSPLSVVALQWFTKTKYMFGLPITNASGAVLIAKAQFDKLPAEHQQVLLDLGKKYFDRLTKQSRQDNEKSVATLEKKGIKVLNPSAQAEAEFAAAGKKARESLAGTLYSKELLAEVETAVAQYKKPAKAAKK